MKTNVPKIKKLSISQSRNYCFTDFEILDLLKIYMDNKSIIRGIGFGHEIAPTTKKPHLQGLIQFYNKKRLGGVKRIFGSKKIHVEPCYGSVKQNQKYCAKDNKYVMYGEFICQSHRSDLENIKKKLDEGGTLKEVADDHFGDYIRYHHGLQAYKKMCDKERTKKFRKIDVELVCGSTGTNKTRNTIEQNPNAFKITGKNLKWWDGYEQEETLIIDEYSNDIGITEMLNILDGYQLRLEIKGSFTYANWTKVIITTNLHPCEIHSQAKAEHRSALNRRITTISDLYNSKPRQAFAPRKCRGVLG